MKNSETPRLGRPAIVSQNGEGVVKKEYMLFKSQAAAIARKARETKEREGRNVSASEALRDIVGYWMEREGM